MKNEEHTTRKLTPMERNLVTKNIHLRKQIEKVSKSPSTGIEIMRKQSRIDVERSKVNTRPRELISGGAERHMINHVRAPPAWATRHPIWKVTTAGYQSAQGRMVEMLAGVADSERYTTFSRESLKKKWAKSTAQTYLQAWMTAKKALGETTSVEDAKINKHLQGLDQQTIQYAQPMPPATLALVLRDSGVPLLLRIAIALTYATAQRISDILQLHKSDLTVINGNLAITVRRGKVKPIIGPYTIFLSMESYLAQTVLAFLRNREGFLFSSSNSIKERATLGKAVLHALRRTDPQLEQRSIRHGAVHNMGLMNVDATTIMTFTRHSSEKMLSRYMANGVVDMNKAHMQAAITASMEFSWRNISPTSGGSKL